MFRSEIYFEGDFYDVTWTQSLARSWHDVKIAHIVHLPTGSRTFAVPDGLKRAVYNRGVRIREASKYAV